LEFDAFRVSQRGGWESFEIYVSVLMAQEVIDRCAIDRWTPQNQGGYQRFPVASQLKEGRGSAVRYLMREMGCFPTSILVNIRGEAKFREEASLGWCSVGRLDVGEERFWLIDGQHRIEALKRAIERNSDFERYPVILSILRQPARFDELMLFYIVNRRQKSVPTDLAYRHLQRMLWEKGTSWLADLEGSRGVRLGLASEAVDGLNSEPRSPFYRRIRMVGQESDEKTIVSDKPFIASVAEILREKVFSGLPVRELADTLIDFWSGIKAIYPEAFTEHERYTLLSTPGLPALNMLFPSIYARCVDKGVSEASMKKQIEGLLAHTKDHPKADFRRPLTIDFWSKEKAPSVAIMRDRKNVEALSGYLLEKIKLALG